MPQFEELEKFYIDLGQEVINKATIEETEDFRENVFTQLYIDYLYEAAEIEDGNVCYHESRGIKVNGYSISEDESLLTLFVSVYKNSPKIFSVSPSEAQTILNKAKQFYLKSLKNYHKDIEEAYSAFDLARTIFESKNRISEVRIILMTNGTVRSTMLQPDEIDGVTFIYSIWDLERIYRVSTSGATREKIELDLEELTGKKLNAIKIQVPFEQRITKTGEITVSGGYTSYLTIIPGDVLYKIYEKYDARLLEKNVRAFLQARGGVNKGIRGTINETPEMFLAYNNGISATAESIQTSQDKDSSCIITHLSDFQIVNGGQTTASIFNSCQKNKDPLDKIFVQAKITVLNDQEQMDKVVPLISSCANTQNKVQLADFSANDEFHQNIEILSRTVWAPAKTGGEQQTRWFYERARGQYADIRSREKSVKYFDLICPKEQYFDKIELARYENLWEQLPHIASRGGQAGFRDFTIRLKKRGKFVPNQDYFQNLIAKGILYKNIRKIVRKQSFLGFWANVADYTFAYISYKTAQRLDLQKIWKNQNTTEEIDRYIEKVANAIYKYLTEDCANVNTTQWCKKEDCWLAIKNSIDIKIDTSLSKQLLPIGNKTISTSTQGVNEVTKEESILITDIQKVSADIWFSISSWGKETKSLKGYQNGIAFTLGRYVGWKKEPSFKQSKQGLLILKISQEKGFNNDEEVRHIISKHAELISEFS